MELPAKQMLTMACLIISLSACSNTQTYTVGDGKGQATVTTDGSGSGTVKVNGPEGQSTMMNMGSNATYPTNLPFPQYPSSKITLSINQDGKLGHTTISLDAGDTTEKIIGYYRNWFSSNNWKISAETNTTGMGSIIAQKEDLTTSIMAMPGSGNRTTIQITMSTDK